MRPLLAILCAVLSARGGLAECADPSGGTSAPKSTRRIVWSDEFEGNAIDRAKWGFRASMSSTDCLYANDARTHEVRDSMLFLHVRPSPDPTKRCLLPMGIATHETMAFKYGYLEMRARVPFRHGAWPSFWMQSTPRLRKCRWMSEVDIFENFSSVDSIVANLHKWHFGAKAENAHVMLPGDEKGLAPWRTHRFANPEKLNEEFHTYGLEWTPATMTFFVDGIRFAHVPIDEAHDYSPDNPLVSGMAGHQDYHSIILNNEVFTPGHGWCPGGYELKPEDLPILYQIDWIRLWQGDGEHLKLL